MSQRYLCRAERRQVPTDHLQSQTRTLPGPAHRCDCILLALLKTQTAAQVWARGSMTVPHLPLPPPVCRWICHRLKIQLHGKLLTLIISPPHSSNQRWEHGSVLSLLTGETEASTSKCRWRLGNMGAQQDEGIASPEIKVQASHTHQNKTTALPKT